MVKQMALWTVMVGLIVLWGMHGLPAQAETAQDCSSPVGVMESMELRKLGNSLMDEHVGIITCIASSLTVGNYENASRIAAVKLAALTTGGKRSGELGYNEPSQILWERGYAFGNRRPGSPTAPWRLLTRHLQKIRREQTRSTL